jgi:hypothetical protein
MLMDQLAKENLLKHLDTEIQKLCDVIAKKRPGASDETKEQATTWWQRGQVFALEQLKTTVTEDKEQ